MRFAFRRALRAKALIAMLLLLLIVPPFAARCGETSAPPNAGYVCPAGLDGLCGYLNENGFIRYNDPDLLRMDVERGVVDCGAIIPEDMEARLADGDLEESIEFILSPMSLTPELWRGHLAAAVYSMRAPYITAQALEGTGLEEKQVISAYEAMLARGFRFDFELEYSDGGATERVGARSMVVLALGMLVFLTQLFGVCLPVWGDTRLMLERIGREKAIKHLLRPQLIIRSALVFIFACAGAWLSGFPGLWAAIFCYTVCCVCLGAVLLLLIKGGSWLWCLAVFACAGALPLLPVYFDAALTIPVLGIIRCFDPVCWLWLFEGNMTAGAVSAAMACALCYTTFKIKK